MTVIFMTFQFTHPGKGATRMSACRSFPLRAFQFTHPGKGATEALWEERHNLEFQFTHPGKGATSAFSSGIVRYRFQFTHPGKGATGNWIRRGTIPYVSIHAPWEGCDPPSQRSAIAIRCFNSRTLGRVRLIIIIIVAHSLSVSIHAPWEGCDSRSIEGLCSCDSFNSRTLGRVRRATRTKQVRG